MIKNLKYIAISLVLLSNLCGQKELNGVWVDNENKVFTYPTMQTTGYEIFQGKSSQFVKEWRITCKILDNKIACKDTIYNNYKLIDAWFSDSYIICENPNAITKKMEENIRYFTPVNDEEILVGNIIYSKFKLSDDFNDIEKIMIDGLEKVNPFYNDNLSR